MKKTSDVQLGLVQMTCQKDRLDNLSKVTQKIKALSRSGAQIICLQELFLSRYFCQKEDPKQFHLAELIPGPTTEALSEVAKDNGVVIVASLFEKRTAGIYHNTTAVLDADGTYLGKYRKMHIPDDPGYYEKFYFTPGDLGYPVFKTRFAKLGVLVCWDQWFPEAARLTALNGAEIIIYPTAIGWHLNEADSIKNKQYQAWKTIQASHAIANGVYVVTPNRVGLESEIQFWGGSLVVDPFGTVLYQGSHKDEDAAVIACDLSVIEETRQDWPFLRDRRIDSYQGILKRFGE